MACAAAEATARSALPANSVSIAKAFASRRWPIELMTPTSCRPWSLVAASRSATSAVASGIASKANRPYKFSFSSVSSAASAGTASAVPMIAKR